MRGFGVKIKRSKYGNNVCYYDNIKFDSKIERDRYIFLKAKQEDGIISDLNCHVTYTLVPSQWVDVEKKLKTKVKIIQRCKFREIKFTPDFVYTKDGELVAEDVKGSKMLVSRDFPIRRALLYFFHKIDVKIVTKATEDI